MSTLPIAKYTQAEFQETEYYTQFHEETCQLTLQAVYSYENWLNWRTNEKFS